MRKPYVAGQYIYGNQVIARDVPGKGIVGEVDNIGENGLLKLHPFIPDRLLAKIACSNCHSLDPGAPLRSLPDKFHRSTDEDLIAAFLKGPLRHGSIPYMPRIDLPDDEIGKRVPLCSFMRSGPTKQRRLLQSDRLFWLLDDVQKFHGVNFFRGLTGDFAFCVYIQ